MSGQLLLLLLLLLLLPLPPLLLLLPQTPTLGFTVERHQAIVAFQPEPYWVVRPQLAKVRRTVLTDSFAVCSGALASRLVTHGGDVACIGCC
jgi:hypothetical protein